ncbi:ADP ribosylation factor 4 isoform X2 [Leptinotarsa decemlineata]|uniref:ADP ribosylation factor 4 isoform X2 n=1 Tax=Leptinotarsa decemlineata TaxID=7539 RepID=UPI000C25386B|nr:ADP-ribosylation factor 2-like isoform X2 [Leptinotarsa decemlineata]
MGSIISHLFRRFHNKKHLRILMVGLDGAGKTTILYKLKLGEVLRTIPTVGFNVETVEHANANFTVWDVGGQDSLRRLWKHYFPHTHGIIFVVDSCDIDRIEEAHRELKNLTYETELTQAILLVFANKQDMPQAISTSELCDKLKLNDIKDRKWHIQGVSALRGSGLLEGFKWLCDEISVDKK